MIHPLELAAPADSQDVTEPGSGSSENQPELARSWIFELKSDPQKAPIASSKKDDKKEGTSCWKNNCNFIAEKR